MMAPSSVKGTRRLLKVSVCFFQLASAGRSAAHEAQVKVKLLIPWTAASKLRFSTMLHANSLCWHVNCAEQNFYSSPLSSVFLHRICPRLAPRLSLQSCSKTGEWRPSGWAGRWKGRRGPQGMCGGVCFTSMLVIWGCITLWRQHCTISSHLGITQQDREEKRAGIFTVDIVIFKAHSGQIDPSCPDAYWLLING